MAGLYSSGASLRILGPEQKFTMKKLLVSLISIVAAASAYAASPSFDNFNSGDFNRSGNTIRLDATLTNLIPASNVVGAVSSATTAITATNLIPGTGLTNPVIYGGFTYSTTNGTLTVTNHPPSFDPPGLIFDEPTGTNNFYIQMGRPSTGPGGSFRYWPDHGGPGRPEWVLAITHSIALGMGQAGAAGNWAADRHFQLAVGVHRQWIYTQADYARSDLNWGHPLGDTNLGWGIPFAQKYVVYSNDVTITPYMASMPFGINTNGMGRTTWMDNFNPGVIAPDGTNWLLTKTRLSIIANGPDYSGQGLHWNGILRRECYVASLTSTNYAIDYFRGGTINLAAAGQTNVFFVTTNFSGVATNDETTEVIFRTEAVAATWHWPNGWNLQSESGLAPVTNLTAGQSLYLRIKSVGLGESNKWVSCAISTDNSFAFDPDAADWLTRTSITNTTTDAVTRYAVDVLVKSLKASDNWTNTGVLYIPLTTNDVWNGENLKGNTKDMTWTGGVIHTNSVWFDGVNDWGNTGFNPTTDGYWSQNSAFLALYCGSVTVADGTVLGGAFSGTERAYFRRSGTTATVAGLNNNLGNGAIGAASDWSGMWIANRDGSAQANNRFYFKTGSYTDTSGGVTSGNVNTTFAVGARNSSGTPDNFISYNLRMYAVGSSRNTTQLAAWQAAFAQFKTTMNWP